MARQSFDQGRRVSFNTTAESDLAMHQQGSGDAPSQIDLADATLMLQVDPPLILGFDPARPSPVDLGYNVAD
jgi:hypothetical protein